MDGRPITKITTQHFSAKTLGRSTRSEYDNFGRRVKTILPAEEGKPNPVQETVYNALGQVIKQIDPLGHTVSMEYNGSGRVIRQTNAEGYFMLVNLRRGVRVEGTAD